MKNRPFQFITLALVLTATACRAQPTIHNKEAQIAMSVLAAPEAKREQATVLGFDSENNVVELRAGTNEFVCLGDNPQTDGINIAAYHKDLDPFMARGRELRAEGVGRQDIFDIREKEAVAGTLKMPDGPTTLHILSGPDGVFDEATATLQGVKYRSVVYIPFATSESTGLPDRPASPAGSPWIMFPGTHSAHIMISPPDPNENKEN